MEETTAIKKAIRAQMLEKRAAFSEEQLKQNAANICEKLWNLIVARKVKTLHSFLPMGREVDISPVLEKALAANLLVVTSKTLKQRRLEHLILESFEALEDGVFGTKHPKNGKPYLGNYDMIITPGLAFDLKGHRIGYGAGYYDTFLAGHPHAFKVGVAYPFQILDDVITDKHDVPMDLVVF